MYCVQKNIFIKNILSPLGFCSGGGGVAFWSCDIYIYW